MQVNNLNVADGGLTATESPERADFDGRGRFAPGNSFAFKPGICPNPYGRRGGPQQYLTERLEQKEPDGRTTLETLWERVIASAKAGSVAAFALILDRRFGKVSQRLEVSTDPSRLTNSEIDGALAEAGVDLEALSRMVEEREALALLEAEAGTGSEQGAT